jgi:hypothetical protein
VTQQEKTKNENNKFLCTNCINCKFIQPTLTAKCSEGYFKNINLVDLQILTPYDFECIDFECD